MSNCMCSVCGRVLDCGDTICGVCECMVNECTDEVHCDRVVREVKPNLFVVQLEDNSYSLKWIT